MSPKPPPPAPIFGPRVEEALAQLAHTELFGRSRAEIIERLVCERLRDLKREGWWK